MSEKEGMRLVSGKRKWKWVKVVREIIMTHSAILLCVWIASDKSTSAYKQLNFSVIKFPRLWEMKNRWKKIPSRNIFALFMNIQQNMLLFLMISFLKYPALYLGEKKISDEKRKNIFEAFGFMETFLEGKKWFCGDNLTLADLSICASMSSIIVSKEWRV